MKTMKMIGSILLAVLFLVMPMTVNADEWDDEPYEEETEAVIPTTVPTTAQPAPTVPATVFAEPEPSVTAKPETSAVPEGSVAPPLVKISRDSLPHKPKAGETFIMTVVIHNTDGKLSLEKGLISFEPSEGLTLLENSASKVVPVIGRGVVYTLQIRLRVNKDAAASQSISATYAYSYKAQGALVEAQAAEKLLVGITPSSSVEKGEKAANATPNIIVSSYNYGGTIAAGDAFELSLQFQNTSRKLDAENIVMSVETGDGISITSASNTYYYTSLAAGKTLSQRIPMRVAANASADGARIDISFHYEYVDGTTRSDASAAEKLSIPIYIPDRFSVSTPDTAMIGVANEELSISLPYVNKSKAEVSNVEADLEYDENAVFCEQPHLNLGNFEPGKSGTIDFYFTPTEPGEGTVTVKVKYENELTEEKELTVRVPYSVEAGMEDVPMEDVPTDMPEEESAPKTWLWIGIGAAAAVIVLIVVLIAVKKKRKKKAQDSIDFDWGVAQEVTEHEKQ